MTVTPIRTLLLVSEQETANTISELLAAEGCAVESIVDPQAEVDWSAAKGFELIVAARGVDGMGLAEISRELQAWTDEVAVLTLSGRGQSGHMVVAAPLRTYGALDLVSRAGEALHRVRGGRPPVSTVSFGDVQIDFGGGRAQRDGSEISLTLKELELLRHLVDHRPAAISRHALLRTVWEYQGEISTRTVDVHMASLRQKLERNPRRPRHLRTVRGVGYRFLL